MHLPVTTITRSCESGEEGTTPALVVGGVEYTVVVTGCQMATKPITLLVRLISNIVVITAPVKRDF